MLQKYRMSSKFVIDIGWKRLDFLWWLLFGTKQLLSVGLFSYYTLYDTHVKHSLKWFLMMLMVMMIGTLFKHWTNPLNINFSYDILLHSCHPTLVLHCMLPEVCMGEAIQATLSLEQPDPGAEDRTREMCGTFEEFNCESVSIIFSYS